MNKPLNNFDNQMNSFLFSDSSNEPKQAYVITKLAISEILFLDILLRSQVVVADWKIEDVLESFLFIKTIREGERLRLGLEDESERTFFQNLLLIRVWDGSPVITVDKGAPRRIDYSVFPGSIY